MANIYVYSGAAGAGTGADWTNAYTTVKAAAEAAGTAAGDAIWIAHDHAETTAAALTITLKSTAAAPSTFMCVNRAGTVPPVAADLRTTATITTTGASTMTINNGVGLAYWYGVIFQCGTGAVSSALTFGAIQRLKNCSLQKLGTTLSAGAIALNTAILENTTMQFGSAGDSFHPTVRLEWLDTPAAITGGTVPTRLFDSATNAGPYQVICGVDFSAIAGTLIVESTAISQREVLLLNSKLNAAVAPIGRATNINSDSAATNYRVEKKHYNGKQYTDTRVFRSGGATDGTTPIGWRLESSGVVVNQFNPLESLPLYIWNDTTGARNVDVFALREGGPLYNDELWLDVEYLGSAASPISTTATTGKSTYLATRALVAVDSVSAWGGGTTTTRYRMRVPVVVGMKGDIRATVKVGKPGITVYVDPKVVVS